MGLFKPVVFYKQKVVAGAAVDPDAEAFLTVTGITDPTISSAINQLVLDLKGYGIWSKMIAIYPYVGGTATTHKYNLKDPQDTNGAYRITFAGTVTHSSNGIQGNGTNGVGYTHINIGTNITQNDAYTSAYIRTNLSNNSDLGGIGGGNGIQMNSRAPDGLTYHKLMNNSFYTRSSSTSVGFWQQSRTTSSTFYVQQNATRNDTGKVSTSQTSAEYIAVMAFGLTETTATNFSSRQHAYHAFGQGLSTTEMDDHYTAVQAFQTTLGRNV
jgi:hypothetical protein